MDPPKLHLHFASVPLRKLCKSAVDSQIRNLYEQQLDFAVTNHIIFDTPLDVIRQCPLRSKNRWIRFAQRYHPSTHNRKTGKQLLITSFFTPIRHPITAHTNRTPKQQPKCTTKTENTIPQVFQPVPTTKDPASPGYIVSFSSLFLLHLAHGCQDSQWNSSFGFSSSSTFNLNLSAK